MVTLALMLLFLLSCSDVMKSAPEDFSLGDSDDEVKCLELVEAEVLACPTDGSEVVANVLTGKSGLGAYASYGSNESADYDSVPELVYELQVNKSGGVYLELLQHDSAPGTNFDMFLLATCHPESLILESKNPIPLGLERIQWNNAPQGNYYVVLDAVRGTYNPANVSLRLSAQVLESPPDTAGEVMCPPQDTLVFGDKEFFARSNESGVSAYGGFSGYGGSAEIVASLRWPGNITLELSVQDPANRFDPDIFILQECGNASNLIASSVGAGTDGEFLSRSCFARGDYVVVVDFKDEDPWDASGGVTVRIDCPNLYCAEDPFECATVPIEVLSEYGQERQILFDTDDFSTGSMFCNYGVPSDSYGLSDEIIVPIDVQARGILRAVIGAQNSDVDAFILSACHPDSVLDASTQRTDGNTSEDLSVPSALGKYLLVIDAPTKNGRPEYFGEEIVATISIWP